MGQVRIVSGDLKGRRIRVPAGHAVRPTAERVREALFSIIGERVVGARLLDLYAGSGSLGLEGLSRGAERAVFVESEASVVENLQRNIDSVGVGERSSVLRSTVETALKRLLGSETFDLVLADPPYDQADRGLLELLVGRPRLTPEGLLVVERPARGKGPAEPPAGLRSVRVAQYGDTRLDFYRSGPA